MLHTEYTTVTAILESLSSDLLAFADLGGSMLTQRYALIVEPWRVTADDRQVWRVGEVTVSRHGEVERNHGRYVIGRAAALQAFVEALR